MVGADPSLTTLGGATLSRAEHADGSIFPATLTYLLPPD